MCFRVLLAVAIGVLCSGCGGGTNSSLTGQATSAQMATRSPTVARQEPKNIILIIGDGMGFESVRATSVFVTGQEDALSFHSLPNQARMTHGNASGGITDSAASATSLATGVKVNNGVISLAIPGDGSDLLTMLEVYQQQGKRTGLVTTSFVEDATIAAFAAHQANRGSVAAIAADILGQTRPHLIMGGYRNGALDPAAAGGAGYTVVENRGQMLAFDSDQSNPLAGLFGVGQLPFEFDGDFSTVPTLSEMTVKALDVLDADPDGFFLVVENENIDESGHQNHIQRHVRATAELHQTLLSVLAWANGRTDTLIIVTSDHETGGLSVTSHGGQGRFPSVAWASTGHTLTAVPVYALGPLSENFTGTIDNTDFFEVLTGVAPTRAP